MKRECEWRLPRYAESYWSPSENRWCQAGQDWAVVKYRDPENQGWIRWVDVSEETNNKQGEQTVMDEQTINKLADVFIVDHEVVSQQVDVYLTPNGCDIARIEQTPTPGEGIVVRIIPVDVLSVPVADEKRHGRVELDEPMVALANLHPDMGVSCVMAIVTKAMIGLAVTGGLNLGHQLVEVGLMAEGADMTEQQRVFESIIGTDYNVVRDADKVPVLFDMVVDAIRSARADAEQEQLASVLDDDLAVAQWLRG